MSAKGRTGGKEATIPSNPKWVVIEASDGDSRRWPANTTSNPDAEGNVNFMRPISVDDGLAIKWRVIIGRALAEMLNYDDLDSKSWVLKDWPSGYQFYDHNKGQLSGVVRHDLYLIGSDTVARFRSPAEFTPHAYWLMTDETRDRFNCKCKYCARKPQREISDAFGLSQRGSSSQAHFVDLPRNREKRRKALPAKPPRVFAAVRRAPQAIKLPKGPKQHVNPDLENDMRAALGPKKLGERRWAREGELVWVKLDHPIPVDDRTLDPEKIIFWPGIVDQVQFKAEITPRRTEESSMRNGSSFSGSKNEDLDPWTIVHKSLFKIKLLVVSKTVLYGSDHILPYQSHAPDNSLLTEVQSVIFDLEKKIDDDPNEMVLFPSSQDEEQAEKALFKRFEDFDPFPAARTSLVHADNREEYRKIAAGAFAVAIQIASRLTAYWTPSDEWECKLQMPIASSSGWNGSQERLSSTEQPLHQKVLGATANVGPHTVETRFQGLWWGPERIWMGDLVRLKFARNQFASDGTETIKKTSGAGKRGILESKHDLLGNLSSLSAQATSSLEVDSAMNGVDEVSHVNGESSGMDNQDTEMKLDDHVDAQDLGASSRSLFLRIDGLFVEQVSSEDGQVANEARMCGMIYELADDDWESDGDEGDPAHTANSKISEGPLASSSSATIATPLRNVMPKLGGSSVADAINNSASLSTPPSSTTPGLFGPNPELLSEPLELTDASMDVLGQDGAVNGAYGPPTTNTPNDSQIPPSTTATGSMDYANSLRSAAPKTDFSAPPIYSLSGPSIASERVYPTPPPPSSMKFRPILRDGHEAVFPLTTLAGRYYPGLLSNPLLRPRIEAALQAMHERDSDAIWALEGFVPGCLNSVDATQFLPRRGQMLHQAEQVAWGELVGYWRRRVSERKNAIVVDDD